MANFPASLSEMLFLILPTPHFFGTLCISSTGGKSPSLSSTRHRVCVCEGRCSIVPRTHTRRRHYQGAKAFNLSSGSSPFMYSGFSHVPTLEEEREPSQHLLHNLGWRRKRMREGSFFMGLLRWGPPTFLFLVIPLCPLSSLS